MNTALALAPPSREEWLEQRQHGIGGSEAAAILGLNPWMTAFDVYCQKLGLAEPKAETRAMRLGHMLEPVVLSEYQHETGTSAFLNDVLTVHPQHPEMLGTPDAYAYIHETERRVTHGIELKTAGYRMADLYGEPGSDEVPDHYLIQCAHYMALTDLDRWDLAVLIGGQDFRVYRIHRDRELEGVLIDTVSSFWADHILANEPPTIDASQSAKEYLSRRFPRNVEPLRQATVEEQDLARSLADVRRQIRQLEQHEGLLRNRLTALIGDADGISGDTWKLTWKRTKDSTVTDWHSVVQHLPQDDRIKKLIRGATKPKPGTRRFLASGPLFSDEKEEETNA